MQRPLLLAPDAARHTVNTEEPAQSQASNPRQCTPVIHPPCTRKSTRAGKAAASTPGRLSILTREELFTPFCEGQGRGPEQLPTTIKRHSQYWAETQAQVRALLLPESPLSESYFPLVQEKSHLETTCQCLRLHTLSFMGLDRNLIAS